MSKFPVRGNIQRYKANHPNCDFSQPGTLYRKVMSPYARSHLVNNLVGHLGNADKNIQERQVKIFYKCDPEYGKRVAEGLGVVVVRPKL